VLEALDAEPYEPGLKLCWLCWPWGWPWDVKLDEEEDRGGYLELVPISMSAGVEVLNDLIGGLLVLRDLRVLPPARGGGT